MAKLKAYSCGRVEMARHRAKSILAGPHERTYAALWVVAETKAQAVKLATATGAIRIHNERDLIVADHTWHRTEALHEAGLLDHPTVLMASGALGRTPVVKVDADGGADAIGELIPPPGFGEHGWMFLPVEARYATEGSVVMGRYVVCMKGPDGQWADIDGSRSTDAQIQRQLDLGVVKIVRSGYGEWTRRKA